MLLHEMERDFDSIMQCDPQALAKKYLKDNQTLRAQREPASEQKNSLFSLANATTHTEIEFRADATYGMQYFIRACHMKAARLVASLAQSTGKNREDSAEWQLERIRHLAADSRAKQLTNIPEAQECVYKTDLITRGMLPNFRRYKKIKTLGMEGQERIIDVPSRLQDRRP